MAPKPKSKLESISLIKLSIPVGNLFLIFPSIPKQRKRLTKTMKGMNMYFFLCKLVFANPIHLHLYRYSRNLETRRRGKIITSLAFSAVMNCYSWKWKPKRKHSSELEHDRTEYLDINRVVVSLVRLGFLQLSTTPLLQPKPNADLVLSPRSHSHSTFPPAYIFTWTHVLSN